MNNPSKKKVNMPDKKRKYLADKLGTLTGDYKKVGARGTFNNLEKALKNKV